MNNMEKRKSKRTAFRINKHGQVHEVRFIKALGRSCVFIACADGKRFTASCAPHVPGSMVSTFLNRSFDTIEKSRDWLY
jgi:hypothetical protein